MSKYFEPLRVTLLLTVTVLSGAAFAQQNQNSGDADIHVLPVRDNIYLLSSARGNITASVGPDGILLVDAGPAQLSDKVLAALHQLNASKSIRFIINTSADPDHTGGDVKLAKSGVTYVAIGQTTDATMMAHQGVLDRLSAAKDPAAQLPEWDAYLGGIQKMYEYFNGEAVELFHIPAAHSDGDTIVYFPRANVISTGEIFSTTTYPIIDVARGGSIQGIIEGLTRITDLGVLDFLEEGGTMIVPGHGRLCDGADVASYRDMNTIIRDRVQDMIKKGMTLEQVKAARITRDYDGRYDTPAWTKDMFIEAVYKSLKAQK